MADVGVTYLLDTPGTDITFNQGVDPFDGQDKYYIIEIRGLEAPSLRTPTDPVPLGDGALVHDFYFGARHIQIEGVILVNSVTVMDAVVLVRNTMTDALVSALNAIIRANGTFSFTPTGGALTSYAVRYEVGLETPHADNYNSLQFSFGLIAGDPFP